ncbi:MAG: sigma-70 family RNA polymerase sigma factor [Dysgonamonadaceae bacterium]|jgi:RNA polymerase sigma factor (sigma-70 family)|nr:sigma-70 family RNA polymerase sigma factor [Dysgonamonadaceae bacterium]
MQDSSLWITFKKGDDGAFSQLYENYADLLYKYGIKFIKDQEIVKDCIHDLFIKLYQDREKLPDTNDPLLFLFVSLKNNIIDKLRIETKYTSYVDTEFYVDFYLEQEENLPDLEEQFLEVMSLLSPRQKEGIYLRYQLEMSYDEIAALLKISSQSARNLVHRSIEKIRSKMSLTIFLFFFYTSL